MSTELRRIRKIVRVARFEPYPNTREDPASQSLRETMAQRAHTYALSKVRVIEGYVTLPQLAAERGIQAQLARLWLKAAGVEKPRDRWVWAENSKALKRARKALGLP